MKRRSFLKILGAAALAPKEAVKALSNTTKAADPTTTTPGGKFIRMPLQGTGVSGSSYLNGNEEMLRFFKGD